MARGTGRGGDRDRQSGRIPLPRLVVGILLHICVPAYLFACLVACLWLPVAGWAAVPERMLRTGVRFIPAFAVFTAAAALLAGLIDPWLDLPAADEAAGSQSRLAAATRALAALGDRRIDRALATIDRLAWNHGDAADRQVVADLAAAARTFAAAVESAAPDRRVGVLTLAAESAERLAAAGEALAAARSRLDEGDAHTVARYLAARYGE